MMHFALVAVWLGLATVGVERVGATQPQRASHGHLPPLSQRLYNPPENDNELYKLRQWTQQATDTPWCATAKPITNQGEQVRTLREETCNVAEERQYFHRWMPIKEQKEMYMFRFNDGDLCLTSHASAPASAPTKEKYAKQKSHQKRDLIDSMMDAVGIDRHEQASKPAQEQAMAPVVSGAPSMPTSTPVAQLKSATSAAITPISGNAGRVMLSSCTGEDAQIFLAKPSNSTDAKGSYYQIKSLTSGTCLSGQNTNMTDVILSPCHDTDKSQLWLFDNIKETIAHTSDKMTVFEYAAAFQVPNIEKRLGMARDTPVDRLSDVESAAVARVSAQAQNVFEMIFRLCDYIRVYVQNVWSSHQSGAAFIGPLTRLFLTPTDRPRAWSTTWSVAQAVLSVLPLPFKLFTKGFDHLVKEAESRSKPRPPTPATEAAWDQFALEQSDVAADALYLGFMEMFRTARISQLNELLNDFANHKYLINARQFYHSYQINLAQQLLTAKQDDFWVNVCVANNPNLCNGKWGEEAQGKNLGRVYGTWYSSNIPDAAADFLRDTLGDEDNFYKGTGGWKLNRHMFTCPGGRCKARLLLRGGSAGTQFERI
ncbi:hypothetical protein THASP1DRAFT_31940 [Thamnocephalis sphaerospora]|uniref:Uncharacterized protein n=1 Tax=Thamnocephalis sphaerospora TaxID=78915 RepID=A0A4V1IW41_9FUNG|nr:hypothetical protein THASP1DRAFT_31940 [Thamnocephalis sphaerospora]|eukprot:RKP06239.1 hypothetical protein THASP1DRAFT_31940 [Thamnocephalis sphaerospora]